jgi:hypothetical protein
MMSDGWFDFPIRLQCSRCSTAAGNQVICWRRVLLRPFDTAHITIAPCKGLRVRLLF